VTDPKFFRVGCGMAGQHGLPKAANAFTRSAKSGWNSTGSGQLTDPLCQIQRANEIAKFGLAEARRSILSLRSSAIEQSGLTTISNAVRHAKPTVVNVPRKRSEVRRIFTVDERLDVYKQRRIDPEMSSEFSGQVDGDFSIPSKNEGN
jgi:hypothetical protein